MMMNVVQFIAGKSTVGRRSDHSKEELYELALQAARAIIDADGPRALTARNVADAIGYSPGTLYNLFENLDDLITHLNGRLLDEMGDALAGTPVGDDARENLMFLLHRYLSFIGERANLWNLVFEHTIPGDGVPTWYQRKVEKVISILERALAPAFRGIDGEGPKRSARVLWASLHGIWSLGSSGKLDVLTSETTTEMAENLIATYVAGIEARREHGKSPDHPATDRPGPARANHRRAAK
jgi:AcrR family transcriptional regulator